ncbi:10880_t:CDS:2 [Funneliformis geosporum]|uniref:10880_t:CDS:1 n=1 Tax=Funneliformis geosporum TaxID=1117311 RepID=A0A9W4WV75_9GLOM|nr:10880_t:CDS:2 [Funneliformis geosporum]
MEMVTSEQDLSQSYEANSSRLESCDMVELKPDQHDKVIAKLDKNIIMKQELKQQLSSPVHILSSDQI